MIFNTKPKLSSHEGNLNICMQKILQYRQTTREVRNCVEDEQMNQEDPSREQTSTAHGNDDVQSRYSALGEMERGISGQTQNICERTRCLFWKHWGFQRSMSTGLEQTTQNNVSKQ